MVITSFNPDYPLIRFGTGDLSAVLPGPSPCGRTNVRIRGWMGRADQTTKVRGMFVTPKQVGEITRRHPEVVKARLVVAGETGNDNMTLRCEVSNEVAGLKPALIASIRECDQAARRNRIRARGQPAQRRQGHRRYAQVRLTPARMQRRCLVAFALFALLASAARAQDPLAEEVPYIRTPQAVVDKMLDLAEVGPDDFLIDLGSGDGRIVITAAQQRGARGFGVELDASLVESSNEAARKAGVAGRARFFARDLFDTDIHEASVLTLYLLPEVNLQLRPRILAQLKPGARVVSHDWDMGEWRPDAKAVVEGLAKPVMPLGASTVYLWIVPARVAGSWRLQVEGASTEQALGLEFTQRFQEISGVARRTRGRTLLQSAHLRGAEIRFAVIDETRRPSAPLHFFGRVYGDMMEGTSGTGQRWSAQRTFP